MDLHYSQTTAINGVKGKCFTTLWIYTILKRILSTPDALEVLLPYGFTLFSNFTAVEVKRYSVLLPYGFTLFSNGNTCILRAGTVLLPYGFTLFSNMPLLISQRRRFYYLMDLHYSQTIMQRTKQLHLFYYLMDLHYSQTSNKLRPLYSAGQIHKI